MLLTGPKASWFWFPPGGCHNDDSCESQLGVTEEQTSVDSLATAAIISEDPHAVLVEFSSVVAETQEYIIKVSATGIRAKGKSGCLLLCVQALKRVVDLSTPHPWYRQVLSIIN